jgi:hypothetical protein
MARAEEHARWQALLCVDQIKTHVDIVGGNREIDDKAIWGWGRHEPKKESPSEKEEEREEKTRKGQGRQAIRHGPARHGPRRVAQSA